jgi:hypothetical protein
MRNAYRVLLEGLKGIDYCDDLDRDGWIALKLILGK